MSRPIVFLDCETTGLSPFTRRAWEIACIRRHDGVEKTMQFMIWLPDLRHADPMALQMSRFYDRHPLGQALTGQEVTRDPVSLIETARAIVSFTHNATIVGAQPSFDTVTLERLLHGRGLLSTWHYRLVDVESLTAGYLRRSDVGGLAGCATALGLEFPEDKQHTALGDAEMAMKIYDRIMGGEDGESEAGRSS